MNKMTLLKTFLAASVAGGIYLSASAQVIVNEDFEGGFGNWGAGNGTLDTGFGNPGSSVQHPGGTVNEWTGSTFSLSPTNGAITLTGDIHDGGAAGSNTIGLRGGPFPLFEMGHYAGDATATGGGNDNFKVRINSFAGNPNWVGLTGGAVAIGAGNVGWNRWEAIFTDAGVTINLDIGITGTIDYTYTSLGATAGNFSNLRIGGPSNISTAGSTVNYDNINLSQIPEPSTYAAIFGGLALLGAFVYRRRSSVKK